MERTVGGWHDVDQCEGDDRVFDDVEEIGRAQMVIAFLVFRVKAGGLDPELTPDVASVDLQFTLVLREDPADREQTEHAPGSKRQLAPAPVNAPGAVGQLSAERLFLLSYGHAT